MRPCPNCSETTFVEERCDRCGRPRVPDADDFDELEALAGAVVSAAYRQYGDDFSLANEGRSPVQQAVIELGRRMKHYHYEGDGCLDEDGE